MNLIGVTLKKICLIVTVSMTVDQFLRFSFEKLHDEGYEITLIADMDDRYLNTLPEYIIPVPIRMRRGIDIIGMFVAIYKMYKIFIKGKIDLVQYSTPNASFYASIASFLARVPIRLYCQWGLVYQGFSGIKRKVFENIEKLVCKLSTDVQPDSFGNLKLCRELGYYDSQKSRVVWNGSANGVNLSKFDVNKKEEYRKSIREKYHIENDTCVLGYVGRVGKEKGFEELITVVKELLNKELDVILLYVGPNEKPETVKKEYLEYFETCDKIIYTGGWVDDAERYYAAMDILIFPTYHEGFGSVSIEAEAMGVPVVGSDVPGPQDAIIDGKTGFLVPAKDANALLNKVELLVKDKTLRDEMGKESYKFSVENFDEKKLLDKIIENKEMLLNKKKIIF